MSPLPFFLFSLPVLLPSLDDARAVEGRVGAAAEPAVDEAWSTLDETAVVQLGVQVATAAARSGSTPHKPSRLLQAPQLHCGRYRPESVFPGLRVFGCGWSTSVPVRVTFEEEE